jgi:hypothetical protein
MSEGVISSGRKKIRKLAKQQNLIGKVVGPNGTPEKPCASASASSQPAGEII